MKMKPLNRDNKNYKLHTTTLEELRRIQFFPPKLMAFSQIFPCTFDLSVNVTQALNIKFLRLYVY